MTILQIKKYFDVSLRHECGYYALYSLTEKGRLYPKQYMGHFQSAGNGKFSFDGQVPTSNLKVFLEQQKTWLSNLEYFSDCYHIASTTYHSNKSKFIDWVRRQKHISFGEDEFGHVLTNEVALVLGEQVAIRLYVSLETDISFLGVQTIDNVKVYGVQRFSTLSELQNGINKFLLIHSFQMTEKLVSILTVSTDELEFSASEISAKQSLVEKLKEVLKYLEH
jgi:hypothetical protein